MGTGRAWEALNLSTMQIWKAQRQQIWHTSECAVHVHYVLSYTCLNEYINIFKIIKSIYSFLFNVENQWGSCLWHNCITAEVCIYVTWISFKYRTNLTSNIQNWSLNRGGVLFSVGLTYKLPLVSSFYDRDFPLYTLPRYLPPTIVTDAAIKNSIIGDGCILNVRN